MLDVAHASGDLFVGWFALLVVLGVTVFVGFMVLQPFNVWRIARNTKRIAAQLERIADAAERVDRGTAAIDHEVTIR